MKIRDILVSVSVLMLSGVVALAQKPEGCPGKFNGNPKFMQKARAERAEFVASKLDLGDEEKQVFLTVYDEVEEAKQACMAQRHSLLEDLRKAVESGDDLAVRVKHTRPQKELDAAGRQNNLKKAFKITGNDVKLKTILLIDDIYTTGSTMDALSQELLAAGAAKVYFITIACGT